MRQHHQASFEDLPIDEDYRTPPRSRRRLWVGASITIIAALCPLLANVVETAQRQLATAG